jgi:c-di-GMP-binding flagellar brake protein YcgR
MPGKERRHFFRVATELNATCRPGAGPAAGVALGVRVVNLSPAGAWLELPEPLEEGQALRLDLAVPDPPLTLSARAHVVRTADSGARPRAAVEFRRLDRRTRADLTRFVFAEARRSGRDPQYLELDTA